MGGGSFFDSIKKYFQKKPSKQDSLKMCTDAVEKLNETESQLRREIDNLNNRTSKLLKANRFEQNPRRRAAILRELRTVDKLLTTKEKTLETMFILQKRVLKTQSEIVSNISNENTAKHRIKHETVEHIDFLDEKEQEELKEWNSVIHDVSTKLSIIDKSDDEKEDSDDFLLNNLKNPSPKR